MRRKIAAILVAHIADYGRLVADDEEETLRRMASCRTTIDDFIAIAGGRIFNTAGDAVLAEFPSAVEAVRCAIDIQESLRTRNLAYPGSREMSYRIGIGIGDVVERDGDLLGDGVNIAARLEGLAEVGGICISRAVHEQVTGKLSARFIDIGARKVKNIPTPVHAYIVVTWDDGRSLWGVAADRHSGKRKIGQEVAFGRTHRRRRAMHCGFCFLCCNPEARRQGFVEPNCCRSIAAGADEPASDVVANIATASNAVVARAGDPSHQFNDKRIGRRQAFASILRSSRDPTRLDKLHQ